MSQPETTAAPTTPAAAHEHDGVDTAELARALRRRTPRWKPIAVFTLLLLAGAGVVALGAIPKAERQVAAGQTSARLAAAARRVQLAPVREAPATRTLALPASLEPDMHADVYAQATGYLARRAADIGDKVRAGDVLAEIDIPLVEQDLRRAQAAQAEAVADREKTLKNLELARTTLERWRSVQANAVSRQELDERQAAYDALQASVASADALIESRRADVQRLEREKLFGQLVAPFDGVITARSIDIGDYISSTGADSPPLFSLSKTDSLRVSVDIPQAYAYSVKVGQSARVVVREIPGRVFEGVVARTSGSLDERTRSLRAEVQVPNPDGHLLSGSYATIQLDLATPAPAVIVPGSAVIVRAEGPRVAVVDAQNRIKYVPVKVRRDLGTEVEISEGLAGWSFVVVNLSDELPPDSVVEAVKPPAP